MSNEVTQESFEQIIEDATYLQDEAEALRYVIDTVPYEEDPPDDHSILHKLLLLDYLQLNYYRPVFEKARINSRDYLKAANFHEFCEKFHPEKDDEINIQKTLNKLAKHRAALINTMKKIPLIDWEKIIYKNNTEITLYHFAVDMVHKDRSILKEIAEMVMVFQKDAQSRREIDRNKTGREPNSPQT
jgi:hypothetical protein